MTNMPIWLPPPDDEEKRLLERMEKRYERLRPELEKLPPGSNVAMGIETEEYATGPNMNAALDAFDRRFGEKPVIVRRIGQLMRV